MTTAHQALNLKTASSLEGATITTITLDLRPDIESGLTAQATARGVSLIEYVNGIVVREAHVPQLVPAGVRAAEARNLIELFEPVRGLLTDEEVDTIFKRNPSFARPVDFG